MVAVPYRNSSPSTQSVSLAQATTPREDQERRRRMRDAWEAYHGEFKPPLKIAADQPDDSVLSNRCCPIVDKGVSFLFGPVLKIEDTGGVGPVQDFLDGIWGDDDDKMSLLSQAAINGGVCGEVFLKLIPSQGKMRYPRIVVLNPSLVRIVTAPDDCSLTIAYVIEYSSSDGLQHRQIISRVDPDNMASIAGEYDLDDSWIIANYERKGQAGMWHSVGSVEEWLYPFAPIFCCQNLPNPNEAWGMPDLTSDLINMNKVLNFVQSNTSRIIKYHGHPITYAIGLGASQIQIGIDDLVCLPETVSKLEKLAAMENFNGLIEFASVIRSDMDEQSRVPAVALGRLTDLPKGQISGVALQLLFQPLLEKTTQKRRLYGRLIREISKAALVCEGLIPLEQYEDYPIELHWQDLLPIDDLQAAQTGVLLLQLGVSQSTVLQRLGYDPEVEGEKSTQQAFVAQVAPAPSKVPAKPATDKQPQTATTSTAPTTVEVSNGRQTQQSDA